MLLAVVISTAVPSTCFMTLVIDPQTMEVVGPICSNHRGSRAYMLKPSGMHEVIGKCWVVMPCLATNLYSCFLMLHMNCEGHRDRRDDPRMVLQEVRQVMDRQRRLQIQCLCMIPVIEVMTHTGMVMETDGRRVSTMTTNH